MSTKCGFKSFMTVSSDWMFFKPEYKALKNIQSELTIIKLLNLCFVLMLEKHPIRANSHKTFKSVLCTQA
jgi:hypothetical protein